MVTQREIVNNRDDEETLLIASKPVDISCKSLRGLEPIALEAARTGRIGGQPFRISADKKYLSRAVWLNNNLLTNLHHLDVCINSLLEYPERLGWLDLSYNYINEIDEIILQFVNLKILYLHGNCIQEIFQVKILKSLSQMRSLTLHGNPISNIPYYRGFVMGLLPQLVTLDFVPILKYEKMKAKPAQLVKLLKKHQENIEYT